MTKLLPRQTSLAKRMRAKCCLPIEDGPPCVYKLPVHEVMKDDTHQISKCHIGKPSPSSSPEKVIMVLGATGSGKSTLVNGMVNYVLGVEWNDDFRFKLITDEAGGKSQAHSQTQVITAYTLHRMEGSRVPYTLTIIDTPGFGDTRGLKRDREITAQIKEFFSIPGDNGIDHLDGIGFVTQASLARLTPTQQYIFDSILSTFGNDIKSNIFMMITFADGNKPPVMDAIKAGNIPFAKAFKFNNSALYTTADSAEMGEDDDEDEDDENFAEMFWKMGLKSFKGFFTNFGKVQSVSLLLTREVLKERQNLEVNIQGLQTKVKNGLSQIDVLHQEQLILKTREAEMAANKNFKYKVKVPKTKRVDLSGQRVYVTNCLNCNFTCHYPCGIANNEDKSGCAAMNRYASDATCTVCPCRGHWTKHVNNPYRFEEYEEEEERTIEDLKKRYKDAESGKNEKETMVANMEKHLEFLYTKVLEMVQEVKRSLNRLDEIALKANPLTEVEYIELLIESEKQQAKDGYQQRIQYYEEVKKQANLVRTVKAGGIPDDQTQKSSKYWWEKLKFW